MAGCELRPGRQLRPDAREHNPQALADIHGREPQNAKASGLEPSRTGRVSRRRTIEHLAADLDHQARRQAREVHDVGPDQRLAAELETVELFGAQARPQIPLDAAHRAAEVSGELDSG
jgi:hypothetical protein